jgi:copper resistance protein B
MRNRARAARVAATLALAVLATAVPAAAQPADHAHGNRTISFTQGEVDYSRQSGEDVVNWEAEGFVGGDVHKFWWKTEGEHVGSAFETAEFQGLYSRNIWTFFDVQGGIRADVEPDARAYGVIGVQGLMPYLLETELHAFIGFKGDALVRLRQSFDVRMTNRLILEPQIETDIYLTDVPERRIGSGFSTIETGLQARYEISRKFAPTVAVVYESRLGKTARLAEAADEPSGGWSVRVGLRSWF